MRYIRIFIVFGGLLFFSCSEKPVEKPQNLLSEEVMTDVLYDTVLLQAAEGYVPEKLTNESVRVKTFIYNKYKIDSVTYYQNHKYYAANLSKYEKMYKKIMSRLEEDQAKLDSLDGNKTIEFKKKDDVNSVPIIPSNGSLD